MIVHIHTYPTSGNYIWNDVTQFNN